MKTKERSAICWKMMQIREARGYNHEDMAEFLGTSASTYQRLESGQTVAPATSSHHATPIGPSER